MAVAAAPREIPPPPPLDFPIAFAANSASVQKCASSGAVQLSIAPNNSSSETVRITLSSLPSRVASNPVIPCNVTSAAPINLTSPLNAATGSVKVTAYFLGGWLALAPHAFSYGPQILQVFPNAGDQSGGDTIQICGYGFGSDATKLSVTIDGSAATIQNVENISCICSVLGVADSDPFQFERITLQSPAGSADRGEIIGTSAGGSTTAAKSFQYLQYENFCAMPPFDKFILDDQRRQWLCLSNIDHVDIFDLAQVTFRAAGLAPPGGPPPTA